MGGDLSFTNTENVQAADRVRGQNCDLSTIKIQCSKLPGVVDLHDIGRVSLLSDCCRALVSTHCSECAVEIYRCALFLLATFNKQKIAKCMKMIILFCCYICGECAKLHRLHILYIHAAVHI